MNENERGVFERIRTECARVAARAADVWIVHERVPAYVRSLLGQTPHIPALDVKTHFLGEEAQTAAFFVCLDAINFGSGYFPHLAKPSGLSGYFTIAVSLTEHFQRAGVPRAEDLVDTSPEACARIFGQSLESPPTRELMTLFAKAWRDLGEHLLKKFDGSFVRLIASAEGAASHLVATLSQQPLFRDVATYRGREVPFYKRAQLLASDLVLAFQGRGLGHFDDLGDLTIFADNLVPHVLRVDGILEYSVKLADVIDHETLIPAGSTQEVEIRACSVAAVEIMREIASTLGMRWTARDLDQVLWHRGQAPAIKQAAKRHRTRSVFY